MNLTNSTTFLGALLLTAVAHAQTNFIAFDDGTTDAPVENFYASQGVAFTAARWVPDFVGTLYCTGQATAPLEIGPVGSNGRNSSADPIIAVFAAPQRRVSILAVNVGFAGAQMDAYDAPVGGSLVASSQAFGTTEIGEVPCGALAEHEEFVLEVRAPSIGRIELYRPRPQVNDGVFWDNLMFDSIEDVCPALSIRVSHIELCWPTCAGCVYQLQYRSMLTTNDWNSLFGTNVVGTGSVVCFTVPKTTPESFYRLHCVTNEPPR